MAAATAATRLCWFMGSAASKQQTAQHLVSLAMKRIVRCISAQQWWQLPPAATLQLQQFTTITSHTMASSVTCAAVGDSSLLPPCLQIEGMSDTIKTATAARVNPAEEKLHKANEGFLQDEGGKQQLMLRWVWWWCAINRLL
jgi:hypothetical protein